MNAPFEVRGASARDLASLAAFNQAMARETEGRALDPATLARGVAQVLEQPAHGRYFVAAAPQGVVGALLITYEWSDWRNGTFWWLQSVYVVPEWRRRGVFRALYEHVREAAQRAGAVGLRLYVERDNVAAQRTYAKLGLHTTPYLVYEAPAREW